MPRTGSDGGQVAGQPPDENAYARWFLVDGNRWTIVGGLSVVIFLVLVGLGLADVVGVEQSSLVTGIFSASITGVFTLVSVTITINQLVLSRVLGSPETIEDRIDSVHEFRTDVQEMVDPVAVSPTDPAAFMELVTHALSDRVERLQAVYDDSHDADQRRRVEYLVARLSHVTTEIENQIGAGERNLDHLLSTVLNNRFSRHLNATRRIEAESDDLTDAERRALDELADILEEINRTRHYFKTLYLHEEIASLSRVMLLTGLPALVVGFVTILIYDGFASGASDAALLVVVSACMTLVLLPLTVLLSYSLKFITVAKRTTTFGTFTPPEELP